MKMLIADFCTWAGEPCMVEVFNLFSGQLRQQGLAMIDRDRDRQAMVPDFRITLNAEGQIIYTLQELKTTSASRSRYKVTQTVRGDTGVDKRADNFLSLAFGG